MTNICPPNYICDVNGNPIQYVESAIPFQNATCECPSIPTHFFTSDNVTTLICFLIVSIVITIVATYMYRYHMADNELLNRLQDEKESE
jgi:hypothetical protein